GRPNPTRPVGQRPSSVRGAARAWPSEGGRVNSPPAGILTLTPSGRPAAHYVDRILAALARAPDQVVLRWRTTSRTAGELRRAVETTAAVLGRRGVGVKSTVAVLTAANSPDALVARYAANLLGAAVVYPGWV